MEPEAALTIASQIAVALAGFVGVVTAFRAQSVHEWEAIDKFRLRLLLTNSILPLAYCLFALALLAIKPAPFHFWRWCSGVSVTTNIAFATIEGPCDFALPFTFLRPQRDFAASPNL